MLAAGVRNHLQYDKWLYEIVNSARPATKANSINEETKRIVQEFFAYRIYDQPRDEIVRTGDVITLSKIDAELTNPPDLFIVITPPCDLDRFWKNTRGVLTLAKLQPFTKEIGIQKWKDYANTEPSDINSITSTVNPFVFPSLPLSETRRMDYILFIYEIEKSEFDGRSLWKQEDGISKKVRFSRPLTYQELKIFQGDIRRLCRISEPFLSGALTTLKDHLFRTGVPDFPFDEKERLKKLFTL